MKKMFIMVVIAVFTVSAMLLNGCYVSKSTEEKSGAQLWAENCNRCHNAPAPGEFNNENWDIAGTHMQVRANFTKTEIGKVIDFLKSANVH